MRPHAKRGGPDEATLRRLVEQENLTDRQIGEMYGEAHEATVRYWRRKYSIERNSTTHIDHRASGAIPWMLNATAGHHQDPIARVLRARDRRDHGASVAPEVLKRIERFERDLKDLNVVVSYDPNSAEGFYFVPRDRSKDDPKSIVRQPQPAQ